VAAASGTLWVVATPIGNLEDLSPRARRILGEADLVLCEDTRRTRQLLSAFGIAARLMALHEHNEAGLVPGLVARLQAGERLALVSDAGTPLVSDPGFRLVAAAAAAGCAVSPVPGPSAPLAALSVAGLATDRFVFEGFLPAKSGARRRALEALAAESRTLVFLETPARLVDFLADAAAALGRERECVVARELTKLHETVYRGTLAGLAERLAGDPAARLGEAVVLIAGRRAQGRDSGDEVALARVLPMLLEELPPSRAVRVAARLTGVSRRRAYDAALALGAQDESEPAGSPQE
jgi:16S rRNA (cytidine1402-2'-O)-methyltransferase